VYYPVEFSVKVIYYSCRQIIGIYKTILTTLKGTILNVIVLYLILH